MIELLVVIALIGVLMSALIPSLKRSMTMARATVCMHNLREVGHGLALYRFENDGWLPTVAKSTGIGAIRAAEPWFSKLYPTYFSDLFVLTCPEDPYRYRMMKVRPEEVSEPFVAHYASYGINSFIVTGGEGMLADLDRRGPGRAFDTILVADLGPDVSSGSSHEAAAPVQMAGPIRPDNGLLPWDDGFDPHGGPVQPWLTTRHGRGINILTADDSVRGARTVDVVQKPVSRYYTSCAAGGCTFCNELRFYHYSFARDRLFWWTGPVPLE